MNKPPERQRLGPIVRAVLKGAGLGLMTVVWGSMWSARGEGRGIDWDELEMYSVTGTFAGAVIGLILYLTRQYRSRGMLQHYLSWALACFVAVFILLIPAIPEEGLTYTVLFALWLGGSAGLGLGVAARQVSRDR